MPTTFFSPRLIMIVKPKYNVRLLKSGRFTDKDHISAVPDSRFEGLNSIIDGFRDQQLISDFYFEQLFGSEDELIDRADFLRSNKGINVPVLSTYYKLMVEVTTADSEQSESQEGIVQGDSKQNIFDDSSLEAFAEELRKSEIVESCYVKPPAHLPRAQRIQDFSSDQIYLGPISKGGINVKNAWNTPGGKGECVNIIDIEKGWFPTHADIKQQSWGGLLGNNSTNREDIQHGTSVIGMLISDHGNGGIDGICPNATIRGISVGDSSNKHDNMLVSTAIHQAADLLQYGDIILLEVEYELNTGDHIPSECYQDDLAAIQYATCNGIIVVEPAGNAEVSRGLDLGLDPIPSDPDIQQINRKIVDSGAIIVGAGNPPSLTHGNKEDAIYHEVYIDRARCSFSNYGECVDTQGWGWEVTTLGSDPTSSEKANSTPETCYTDGFSGTSSAAPMIAGVLACVQGVLRNMNRTPLNSYTARLLLRISGLPQQEGTIPLRPVTQRIGNRPDFEQLLALALLISEIQPPLPKPFYPHICQVTEIIIRCGPPTGLMQLAGYNTVSESNTSQSYVQTPSVSYITSGSSPSLTTSTPSVSSNTGAFDLRDEVKRLAVALGIK